MDADRRAPAWLASAGIAAVLVGFVAWSFAQRWSVLSASPFPLGVDGYFYPIQLRSLLETGTLQYPTPPLTFWLMAPFAAVTDPITGSKLAAAFYGALIALPAYGVGARLGNARGAGVVASALATFSAGSAYLTIEFVKNAIAITIALAALWGVLRALDRPSRARAGLAIVGVIAALLAHKMAAAIVLGIAVPAATAEFRGRLRVWLGLGVVAVIALGVVAPQRFLSPSDAALFGDVFTPDARWSAPVVDHAGAATGGEPLDHLGYEPLLGALFGVVAAAALVIERSSTHRRGATTAPWIVVGLAIALALPWLAIDDPQGLGVRVRIVAFVPMALSAAIALGCALRLVLPKIAAEPRLARVVVCGALALVIALRVPGSRTEGLVEVHPALVSAALALPGRIPEGDTAIVPERHVAFMVAWYARIPVSIRPEPIPSERRWRVVPGAFIRLGSELDRALREIRNHPELPPPIGVHPYHPNGLVAVPEVTWSYVIERLPSPAREHFEHWPTI